MKTKWLIYCFVSGIIPVGFWVVSNLRFETDINAYNLASAEDVARYEAFAHDLQRKEGKETVVVLEKASGWDSFEDFQMLAEITAFWQAQPGVEKASSITDLEYPRKGFFMTHTEPFLDLDDRERFRKRMQYFERYADIFGKFLSKDKKHVLLFVNAPNGISKASAQGMAEWGTRNQGIEAHYIQYDLMQDALESTMRRDTLVLAVISLCLILIGFYVFTQSLRGLGLIALMVAFNVSLTFIVMYGLSMRFTLHMITIPCVITVLSFTDIMHILYHQKMEQARSKTNLELQGRILDTVRIPLFLTSLTNVIGFLIFLVFSNNIHLFNFSLAAMLGVAIAYLSSRFLVIRLMEKDIVFIKRNNFDKLYRVHNDIAQWVWQRKKYVLPAFVSASVLLMGIVASNISIDASEQEYALADSRLTKGTEILQAEFFGAKQAEVFITCKQGVVWDKGTLDQIEQIEMAIDSAFHPLFINSPSVLVKRYHRYRSNGNPAAYFIPARLDSNYVAQLNRHKSQLGGDGVVDSSATKASIVFGFRQMKLPVARKAYAQLRSVLAQQNNEGVHYELTGLQYLSDEATHRFSLKILIGLMLSIVLGSLLVFMFLRSFRKSIGVLLVNLFPMFFALGVMLFFELSVTPLTLFFLSILLGICVDDSIYLITQDKKASNSLHVVPIFTTSFVLSLGFLSLAFSSFEWITPFGWIFLLGISMAYLLDLFALPLFLNQKAVFGNDG